MCMKKTKKTWYICIERKIPHINKDKKNNWHYKNDMYELGTIEWTILNENNKMLRKIKRKLVDKEKTKQNKIKIWLIWNLKNNNCYYSG